VYSIDRDAYDRLCATVPEFNAMVRRLFERCHVKRDKWDQGLHMQDGDVRFCFLVGQHPDFLNRVPARYLSSWLGMTEGMFSTVRSRNNDAF
jgi:hypothetical protein